MHAFLCVPRAQSLCIFTCVSSRPVPCARFLMCSAGPIPVHFFFVNSRPSPCARFLMCSADPIPVHFFFVNSRPSLCARFLMCSADPIPVHFFFVNSRPGPWPLQKQERTQLPHLPTLRRLLLCTSRQGTSLGHCTAIRQASNPPQQVFTQPPHLLTPTRGRGCKHVEGLRLGP